MEGRCWRHGTQARSVDGETLEESGSVDERCDSGDIDGGGSETTSDEDTGM